MSEHVRVRFAPSPTGHLHIGGARTAIYNWAFARHHGGDFVLRIDDTDRERSTEENTQSILRSMRWLGLDWDEGPDVGGEHGPYYQTQRTDLYAQALQLLQDRGGAYPCFCTAEQLEAKREEARAAGGFASYDRTCRSLSAQESRSRIDAGEPHVWRVAVPEDRADVIIDDVIRGTVTWPADSLDDFILARTDGSPTYMFATVVDDWKMGITHVIRGDDHLSNTPRQIMVYEALGAPVPRFAHMGLIFGPDGKRLSKRHGATSVEAYAQEGFLPEALLNYLSLLGWSLDDSTNIFDRDTLVSRFDLSRVSKNPAIWDLEKLEWMNGVYLRDMPVDAFVSHVIRQLEEENIPVGDRDHAWFSMIPPLIAERVKRLDEIVPMIRFLFGETVELDEKSIEKVLQKEGAGAALDEATKRLAALELFTTQAIEETLREVPEAVGVKPKIAFQAIRVGVTGTMVSPPLFESLELLGKETVLARLNAARPYAGR